MPIKVQGSCKTGLSCITHMKVMQDTITGVIMVEYCSTHNSHSVQLAHLPVPSDIKAYIHMYSCTSAKSKRKITSKRWAKPSKDE